MPETLFQRLQQYASQRELQIAEKLGSGIHGLVRRTEFPDEVWSDWLEGKREQFGNRWPVVQKIISELETFGIYLNMSRRAIFPGNDGNLGSQLHVANFPFEVRVRLSYKERVLTTLLRDGGPVIWLILLASAVAIMVFIERVLHFHRAQINSMEFLNGVRNVLKRENVVEALSICDATPGPVARLVKVAILSRERGRDGMREALEEAGLVEVPPLEEKLNLLATIAQIAPLMGLLGTALGFIRIFSALQAKGSQAHIETFAGGIWQALICTAAGLALAIPCYAAYNYLVSRVNAIVLDMEKAASEIVNIVAQIPPSKAP